MNAQPDCHTLHIPHKRKLAINQWSKPYSPAAKEISTVQELQKKCQLVSAADGGTCSPLWGDADIVIGH
jgi:hypothetical protein